MFTIGVIRHLAAVKLKVEPPCANIRLEYANAMLHHLSEIGVI